MQMRRQLAYDTKDAYYTISFCIISITVKKVKAMQNQRGR